MNRLIFVYVGVVYVFVGFMAPVFFVSTNVLLGLYAVLFLIALFLTWKHRSVNALVLLLATLLIIVYTWFDWTDRSYWYKPSGLHSLLGIFLIGYGLLFAEKMEQRQ